MEGTWDYSQVGRFCDQARWLGAQKELSRSDQDVVARAKDINANGAKLRRRPPAGQSGRGQVRPCGDWHSRDAWSEVASKAPLGLSRAATGVEGLLGGKPTGAAGVAHLKACNRAMTWQASPNSSSGLALDGAPMQAEGPSSGTGGREHDRPKGRAKGEHQRHARFLTMLLSFRLRGLGIAKVQMACLTIRFLLFPQGRLEEPASCSHACFREFS